MQLVFSFVDKLDIFVFFVILLLKRTLLYFVILFQSGISLPATERLIGGHRTDQGLTVETR